MGRIVVTEYLSLDGVMEAPGGGAYRHAGWAFETDGGDEARQFKFDELRLMVLPVILGSGKRLFGETSDKHSLRVADARTVGDGVTILVYEPGRRIARAAVARRDQQRASAAACRPWRR